MPTVPRYGLSYRTDRYYPVEMDGLVHWAFVRNILEGPTFFLLCADPSHPRFAEVRAFDKPNCAACYASIEDVTMAVWP